MKASEIKNLREELGLTQFEMAQKVGVTPMTISRWERGISAPSPLAAKILIKLQAKG
jgi:DNA-binding transcriptional regulator YiaG